MLLLHGFTGSSRSWGDGLVDALASAGLEPVMVDLPGHGRHGGETEPARFTLERVFADLEAAAAPTRAADREPVDLLGYSMGGRLALAYAARHPERVRRLVLESASPGLPAEEERAARREADEALARRLEAEGIERFVQAWEALPLFASRGRLPAGILAAQRSLRLRNDPASLAASLRGLGTGSLPSLWQALPGLEVPTLLVVGEEDSKFVEINRRMCELLPRATLALVPRAGHTVHLERPDAWAEAVVAFMRRG